jgi:hypothetical protein
MTWWTAPALSNALLGNVIAATEPPTSFSDNAAAAGWVRHVWTCETCGYDFEDNSVYFSIRQRRNSGECIIVKWGWCAPASLQDKQSD